MINSHAPGTDIEPKAGSFILLAGPRSLNATLLTAIARLAERAVSATHVPQGCSAIAETADPESTQDFGGLTPPRLAVRVLDGGNRFNAYTVARQARGLCAFDGGAAEVLERITISRAFTCYQVLSLLESTPATRCPFVILDLLNTFYDESVRAGERKRLLRSCIEQLHRLEREAGGLVSVHPPAVPSQAAVELLGMLQAATPDVYFVQPAPPVPEPLRLF